MQGGLIVESGTPQTLFTRPVHPYTRKLVDAVPRVAF
jgi:ABC-type dipeptide/oligopeptide/nickel transport system ATPase component